MDDNGQHRPQGLGSPIFGMTSSLPDNPNSIARLSFGTVGILGGLGPLAGAHFYRRLIEKTPAESDSDHIPVVHISDPTIPSRVDNLFGKGPSPAPELARSVRLLVEMGAEVIAVPSSTTHAYYREMQDAVKVPVINLLSEVGKVVAGNGFRRPAILATTPTAVLDLYKPYLASGSDPIYPDSDSQEEIQELVIALKSGRSIRGLSERLLEILSRSWSEGIDSAVLACTELCLVDINDQFTDGLTIPIISATEVLVDSVIELAPKS